MKHRIIFRNGQKIHTIDGREVSEQSFTDSWGEREGVCLNFQGSSLADWSSENGGKGRYIAQLAEGANDPKAHFQSVEHASEVAKKRGLKVEKIS